MVQLPFSGDTIHTSDFSRGKFVTLYFVTIMIYLLDSLCSKKESRSVHLKLGQS